MYGEMMLGLTLFMLGVAPLFGILYLLRPTKKSPTIASKKPSANSPGQAAAWAFAVLGLSMLAYMVYWWIRDIVWDLFGEPWDGLVANIIALAVLVIIFLKILFKK